MSEIEQDLTAQYQRDWWEHMKYKCRRGIISHEELKEAKIAFKRRQESRPARLQTPTPAQGAQSVRIPMDRMTELAVEYLLSLDPQDLDLDRRLEKAELFRVAICRWAIKYDWDPPDDI